MVRDTRGSYTFIVNRMLDNSKSYKRSVTVINKYGTFICFVSLILHTYNFVFHIHTVITYLNSLSLSLAMKSFKYHEDKMRPIGRKPEVLGEITVTNNCKPVSIHFNFLI